TPSQSVVLGQTVQLTANARDQNGNPIAATATWASSATSVANVTSAGVVTAVGIGTATVTATATAAGRTATGSVQITVTAPQAAPMLTSVTIAAPFTTIPPGATVQLTATPKDQNGAPLAASLVWNSAAQGIATVNTAGLVTAVGPGTASITVSATV